MEIAAILSLIAAARSIIDGVVKQASIAGAKGELTPEQVMDVKMAARLSDSAWDTEVAAAKQRLGIN